MHLHDIQLDAYATAEAKGLHRNLHPAAPVTEREHTLILLACFHSQLDHVTQAVKRHGINAETRYVLEQTFLDMAQHLTMLAQEAMSQDGLMSNCTHMSQSAATLIRLALMYTEISEASECIEDVNADLSLDTCAKLTEEIADTVIRGADLAATLGTSLDASVGDKLAYNRMRPMQYGTPGEAR